jgi:ESS family glutamate:Na+ symporter
LTPALTIELDVLQTTVLGIALLFLGGFLCRRIGFLRDNNIPVPVAGGLLFALVASLLYTQAGVALELDMALRTPLMLIFFATVGLSADLGVLKRGGPRLVLFLAVVSLFLILQNGVGVAVAMGFDLHPLVGLLSGSITLSGGHGTGAAYAERFASVQNLRGAMELAMACATFGLIAGGIIGGPVAQRLIVRHALTATETAEAAAAQAAAAGAVTADSVLQALFLTLVCTVGGIALYAVVQGGPVTLPMFIWALFIGILLRNGGQLTGLFRVDQGALDLLATVSLSLFLVLALMALRLWELLSLAGPIVALVLAQTVLMAGYAYLITFRVMGRSYDSAILAGGHCGFGMGATPTAVANMQALIGRYGPSPEALLLVPMVGAFFIDITNALVIQMYLALPLPGL